MVRNLDNPLAQADLPVLWRRIEGPTWLVAAAVYGGWLALTWYHHAMPWWLVLPLGGWLVGWHGGLQHEIIHGHPTRRPWVNAALAMAPLALWLPFPLYRSRHLSHHATPHLTDPLADTESFYLEPARWQRIGPSYRARLWVHNTLAGRLLLGPAMTI
ncbi:MAG: fatty acid desaturase, partial [Rhodospirillaceae bacterium]|nr:fatty acid desaturase [Rhodospirillaceae bacterium]